MSTTRNLFNRALSNLQLGIPSSQPADPDAVDFVNASEYVSEEMDAAGIGLIHKLTIGNAEGTIEITENGQHQVGGYLYADVQVAEPEGTIEIDSNGSYDVSNYAEADVNVPQGVFPEGTLEIDSNGNYDVTDYEAVSVDVPSEEPVIVSKTITQNGTYNASSDNADGYSPVIVNVPSEEPVIVSKNITENGTYYAASDSADGYSPVTVNVPGYPEPTGTINITANGSGINVKDYATANVNVPVPAVQSSKTVTANGTVTPDTGFDAMAKVVVNVPVPAVQASKTVTANGTVTPDAGFDAMAKVVVNVPAEEPVIISKNITANGTYNASSDSADGYSPVVVNVPGPSGSQTFTQNGTYDVSAIAEAIINVSGGGSEWTYESGEFTLATGSRTATFALTKAPSDIQAFMILPKVGSDLLNTASCCGAVWVKEMGTTYSLYGNAAGTAGLFSVTEYYGVSISSNEITYTVPYSYRLFYPTDYVWRCIYK